LAYASDKFCGNENENNKPALAKQVEPWIDGAAIMIMIVMEIQRTE